MPVSPCGEDCLTHQGDDRAGLARVLLRLGRVFAALIVGLLVAAILPTVPERARTSFVRGWFRAFLSSFGIRHELTGTENLTGGLVVSNHVSWLDIAVLQAIHPMRLVAKTEVRSWPVIGSLADRVGTVYLDRDRLTTLPAAVRTVADALREGATVGAFPEGTTWCGLARGRCRPAVFQAAVDAGVRVWPVALRFRGQDGQRTTAAAFIGDMTLIRSVWLVLRTRRLVIDVLIMPGLDPVLGRGELARRAARAISSACAAGDPLPAIVDVPAPIPDQAVRLVARRPG
jgi:1-acyl-sn-glycerol-3-phosphate acyltransferase